MLSKVGIIGWVRSTEEVTKTSEVENALLNLGFEDELERSAVKKVRAGVGKTRGRKYRHRKSVLMVVSADCPLSKAAKNITGVDIVTARGLNAELLAPGATPGRAVLWTEKAIDEVEKNNLYY